MPFDFTTAMRGLCEDVCLRLPEFRHIQMGNVAISFAQARSRVSHGLQAKLTPMRFQNGQLTARRQGREWQIQRYFHGGVEVLYILTFYLPRFQEHSFREKMVTVLHELFHIGEDFNGDIRRLPGHYHVHSHSQREYDQHMARLVDKYLDLAPPRERLDFLHQSFGDLCTRHGGVVGLRVPAPKIILVRKSA
jgi:predicted metallopeptidase